MSAGKVCRFWSVQNFAIAAEPFESSEEITGFPEQPAVLPGVVVPETYEVDVCGKHLHVAKLGLSLSTVHFASRQFAQTLLLVHGTMLTFFASANRDWTTSPAVGFLVTVIQAGGIVATEDPLRTKHCEHEYDVGWKEAPWAGGGPHFASVQSAKYPVHTWYRDDICVAGGVCPAAIMENPTSPKSTAGGTSLLMRTSIGVESAVMYDSPVRGVAAACKSVRQC